MSGRGETSWTWIRRGIGLALLIYIVLARLDVQTWVFVLIAGLLGLWDILKLQDAINVMSKQNGNGAK